MRNAQNLGAALIAALALFGCGDDSGGTPSAPDATPSSPADATPSPADAAADAPRPTVLPLSTAGTDGLFGVTTDAAGNFFAVGIRSATTAATDDREMVVVKFGPTGALDKTFGKDGVAAVNAAPGGGSGEAARGIVVLADGKIVIYGAIEHDVAAAEPLNADRDLAVARLDSDGKLDKTWGKDGILVVNGNDGRVTTPTATPTNPTPKPVLTGPDQAWNVIAYPDGRLLITGSQRAEDVAPVPPETEPTVRLDTDWFVIRLAADGKLDETFGKKGKFLLDVERGGASPRAVQLLADGSIVGAGYTSTVSLGSKTQPVIYKLTSAGVLDDTFGEPIGDTGKRTGYFYQTVLGESAEAYGVALQGDKLVTIGYGHDKSGELNDWISVRLDKNGNLDRTWGKDGKLLIDGLGKGEFADNGRGIQSLPGDRVLFSGTIGTEKDAQGRNTKADAMVVVVKGNGELDSSVLPGGRGIYDLGGATDIFWSSVVSPDKKKLFVVGIRGGGSAPTATNNDDAATLLIPLP